MQAIIENKPPKQQPKNKKRIDSIRDDLKDLRYKLSKDKFDKIREDLYNIEKTKQFNSRKTNKRLNELEKQLLELENTTIMMIMSIKE